MAQAAWKRKSEFFPPNGSQTCDILVTSPGEWGGGGGIPDFKWQGWSNGAKNQNPEKSLGLSTNPKKSPDQKLTPQISHAEFLSLENLQKEKPVWLYLNRRTTWLGYTGSTTNLQIVLNSQKNPCLNQATQENTCQIFLSKKIPKSKISNPKKFLDHPCHPLGLLVQKLHHGAAEDLWELRPIN